MLNRFAAGGAAVFALACFVYAAVGFVNAGDLPTQVLRDDARGFAWFWTFLGAVGVACAYGYWKTQKTTAPDV